MVQGLGVGGLTALVQVVIASMIPPRERGRYAGYIGAVFAVATVSGPLIGGVIVDSPFGWRGCFYVGLPFAIGAFILLQKTLHLPVIKREVNIDYLGATAAHGRRLDPARVGLARRQPVRLGLRHRARSWSSSACVVILAAIYVEAKVAVEPIIPLRLFKDRTTSLATAASVMIGVAMFGSTVYLSQYFQLARGMSPTEAGLMSIAMVGGLLVSSILTGRVISRTGVWKRYLVGGTLLVAVGIGLLGHDRRDHQPRAWSAAFMAVLGIGLGATMQNLVLVGSEQRGRERSRRCELGGRLLPLHGWVDRHLRTRRTAQQPGRIEGQLGSCRTGRPH